MKTRFHDNGRRPVSARLAGGLAVAVAALATCLASSANAAVYAQYTFNDGTANDTGPNGFNGTIEDPLGNTSSTGGGLDLTTNDGIASNDAANGAYVDLPNGILNTASTTGTLYDLSLEIWFTEQTHRSWARLFDLGTSDDGEDMSTSGANSDYVLAVTGTNSSGPDDVFTGETHQGAPAVPTSSRVPDTMAPDYVATAPLPTGMQHHVVLTLAQNGTAGTVGDNGIATLYADGVSVGTAPIAGNLHIDSMVNNNNWLGRSQYGLDQLFDGVFEEFTIYDTALSVQEVSDNFDAGPIAVPFPSLVIDRSSGEITIHNDTSNPISLTDYSIQSADGALNIASWDSVAPDAGWSRTSQTATDASESGGTAQALAPGGSLSLGDLWLQTPTEDLTFNFTTTGDSGSGAISYVGDAIQRSDFDGNGTIDAGDWTIFLANNAQPLGAVSTAAAYLKGDLNGDLANDVLDFRLFKQDYIAANGAAAFASLAGVPEPSALVLCGLAGVLGLLRRRRNR